MLSVKKFLHHTIYFPADTSSVSGLRYSVALLLSDFTGESPFSPTAFSSLFLLLSLEGGAVGLHTLCFSVKWINEACVIAETKHEWPRFMEEVSITTGASKDGLAYKDKVISLLNCFEVTSPGIRSVCLWRRSDNVNWICGEVSPLLCHLLRLTLEIRSCCWWFKPGSLVLVSL